MMDKGYDCIQLVTVQIWIIYRNNFLFVIISRKGGKDTKQKFAANISILIDA